MTTAGIITMLLSISAVWTLLFCCVRRLLSKPLQHPNTKKHP